MFERVQVPVSTYDKYINYACLAQLLGISLYLALAWGSIPDQIPGHYNAAGVVDRWGNKGELIILPVVAWFLYLMMLLVERVPGVWNTGVSVTAENKERVYRILKDLLVTIKLVTVMIFTSLTINSTLAQNLPVWWTPTVLALMFGPMAYFIVKLVKAK